MPTLDELKAVVVPVNVPSKLSEYIHGEKHVLLRPTRIYSVETNQVAGLKSALCGKYGVLFIFGELHNTLNDWLAHRDEEAAKEGITYAPER